MWGVRGAFEVKWCPDSQASPGPIGLLRLQSSYRNAGSMQLEYLTWHNHYLAIINKSLLLDFPGR